MNREQSLQYIGARYVPKFYQNSLDPDSTLWESNVTYEPLTWVSLLNGNMYISKKTVPNSVGTPADNSAYWMEAGQFNAYIQSLQNQINDINDEIDDIEGDITNIENALPDIIADKTHHVIVMGDSYMDGWDGSEYVSNVPALLILSQLNKVLNTNGFRWTHGGMGFLGLSGPTVNSYINDHYSDISEPEKVRTIIIGVGYNDAKFMNSSRSEDLLTAMTTVSENIKTKFPNAMIYLANTTAGYTDLDYGKRITTASLYESHSKQTDIIFVGNSGNILKTGDNYRLISADGIHPTNYGMKYLAKQIISDIFGNGTINSLRINGTHYRSNIIEDNVVTECIDLTFISSGFATGVQCDGEHPVYTETFASHFGQDNTLLGQCSGSMMIRVDSTHFVTCPSSEEI